MANINSTRNSLNANGASLRNGQAKERVTNDQPIAAVVQDALRSEQRLECERALFSHGYVSGMVSTAGGFPGRKMYDTTVSSNATPKERYAAVNFADDPFPLYAKLHMQAHGIKLKPGCMQDLDQRATATRDVLAENSEQDNEDTTSSMYGQVSHG